jgi:hypothetical protein
VFYTTNPWKPAFIYVFVAPLPRWFGTKSSHVKGVGAQGSRPSTTKLIAWVGNGVGFIPWTPYVEGDEIKMKGMRLRATEADYRVYIGLPNP